jgi:hypothetical protein
MDSVQDNDNVYCYAHSSGTFRLSLYYEVKVIIDIQPWAPPGRFPEKGGRILAYKLTFTQLTNMFTDQLKVLALYSNAGGDTFKN